MYVNGANGNAALAQIDYFGERCGTPLGYVEAILAEFAKRERLQIANEIVREVQRPTGSNRELAELLEHWSKALRQGGGDSSRWPPPVPISQLATVGADIDYLLEGMIARSHLRLLVALMKSGKSTWLGFLLKALQHGHSFIGRKTQRCRALIVSEESEGLWIRRREALGLTDAVSLMCRPMLAKPSFADWCDFIAFVADHAEQHKYDLIVLDTTSAFAPWKSENDAAEVQATITPLNRLTQAGCAVLLVHHVGKTDQSEGRAARGSTALTGAVDIILELRRFRADDDDDRRRVSKGRGRFEEVPTEIVIELATDGKGYAAQGDRKAIAARELDQAILDALPEDALRAMKSDDVHAKLPADLRPQRSKLATVLLNSSTAGKWGCEGTGRKGDARRFFRL